MKIAELFERTTSSDSETFQLLKQLQDEHGTVSYTLKDITVMPDGLVNYTGPIFTVSDFLVDENGELKIKLGKCKRICIRTAKLKSLANFPNVLESKNGISALYVHPTYQNSNIPVSNFGNLQLNVLNGDVELGKFEKLNLSRIDKHLKSLNGGLLISDTYKGALLSVLKIKGLKYVEALNGEPTAELEQALNIINDHLQTDGNIVACQEELFKHGLDEYAKL